MSSLIIFSNISGNDHIFFPEIFTIGEVSFVSNINVYWHVITANRCYKHF